MWADTDKVSSKAGVFNLQRDSLQNLFTNPLKSNENVKFTGQNDKFSKHFFDKINNMIFYLVFCSHKKS